MVTSRDVARLAGVSQATVSRALAHSPKVTAETLARVQAAMDSLNYVPHAGAQAMKTRHTNVIGVVVAELTNPFYPEVLDELTKELDAAGYRVVIWNAGGGRHHDALKAIRERAVDGVIFTTATEDSAALHAALDMGSPMVFINRVVPDLDCDQVTSDNVSGGAAVADYLIDSGRTRAAFIGGPKNTSTSQDRRRGFLDRMAERGCPLANDRLFQGDFSHDQSFQIMNDLISSQVAVDAVFCANDFMAFGALDAVHSRGLSVADDVWVIGYDDVEISAWASLNLTTVRQPSREMARAGARMLLQRLASPQIATQHVVFPSELVIRASARAPD